ncbi:TonB-dependent receptor [Caulobacter sp. 73W]|uniref:TonB-dependent receptor n=1 Tax=Caulobacter sp. 73W TaxID=3161137 RepID=A0AB39KYM6_9CAUL
MPFMSCSSLRRALLLSAAVAVAASPAWAQSRAFDISAQPATSGIPAFARQADVQVLLSEFAARGRNVNAVRGSYSLNEGLDRLLLGTGLSVVSNDGRTITLAPAARITKEAAKRPVSMVQAAPVAAAAPAPPPSGEALDEDSLVEAVVVTGFRGSLNAAIDAKRMSAAAVDAIKAEDIADFPDNNLAESIQRVPGVSIARDGGEGRQITVRGLSPQFTRVRINGMEGQSTVGGTDSSGGNNRTRSFDFNVFASELFNSITVRKTPSAEVEEGSLGATVDLQTSRPFDYKGFTVAASAQAGYNDLSKTVSPRFAGLISDRFFDDKVGVLVSVAYSDRDFLEEGFGTVGYDTATLNGGFCAPASATLTTPCGPGLPRTSDPAAFARLNNANVHHPRIPRYGRFEHEQERLGLTASLQWKPTDRTTVNLDALSSTFEAKREQAFLSAFSFSRPASANGKPQTSVRAAEIDADGDLVYGVFDGVDMRAEARYDEFTSTYRQLTLSGEHEFTDRFKMRGLIGTSRSKLDNPIQTIISIDRPNVNGYTIDFRQDSRRPSINVGFDPTNAANFVFAEPGGTFLGSEIRLRPQSVENRFDSGALDAQFELNPNLTFKAGVAIKDFQFEFDALARVSEISIPALPAGVTLASLTKTVSGIGRNMNIPAGTPTQWVTADFDKFSEVFGIYSNTGIFALTGVTNAAARGNIRSVGEKTTGYYVQADFNTDALPLPIRGDIGLRYVKTEQTSAGYQLIGTAPVLVTAKREYDDLLPALNLVADLRENLLLRFGASKVVSRPNLPDLTPGGAITLGGVPGISAGNPQLDPIRAKTYDLSAEWYFARGALVSIGFFYKDIDTYIQTLRETRPFNTAGLPDSVLAGTSLQPTDLFVFTQPVNTKGGPLKGFEFSYQQPFTFLPEVAPFLPDWTKNLGGIFNYTAVKSQIEYFVTAGSTATVTNDLVGLSRKAFNATLYYEDSKFSARVSAAYRDRYFAAIPGGQSGNDADGVNSTFNVDMAVSYNVTPQIKLSFEGLNLTDEFNDQFQDTVRNSPLFFSHTGRQYNFGVQYKF